MSFPLKEIEQGLIKLGLKEETYNEFLPEWIKENGDNEKSRKDYIWHCYNLLISTWAKQSPDEITMYQQQRSIYLEMIRFKLEENKKPTNVTKAFNYCELQINKLRGLNCVAIILGGNRCEQAVELNNMEISVNQALKLQPIPYKLCKRIGGCNCSYIFRVIK